MAGGPTYYRNYILIYLTNDLFSMAQQRNFKQANSKNAFLSSSVLKFEYRNFSKILNTLLFLFSNKIGYQGWNSQNVWQNSEYLTRKTLIGVLLKKQSFLVLRCLPGSFW